VPRHIAKPAHDGNYVIKKGDRCVIHQYSISKLESFYADPLTYEPMRFYEKGVRTFTQGVYPFFNQKPRLCLGRDFALMEAKLFLFAFLRKYAFEVPSEQEITYSPGIILNMKHGFKINIQLRK